MLEPARRTIERAETSTFWRAPFFIYVGADKDRRACYETFVSPTRCELENGVKSTLETTAALSLFAVLLNRHEPHLVLSGFFNIID